MGKVKINLTAAEITNRLTAAANVENKQDKTDTNLSTSATTVVGAINEVNSSVLTLQSNKANITDLKTSAIDTVSSEKYYINKSLTNQKEVNNDIYDNKQDKLTAGTNITITNNVISATGGGGSGVEEFIVTFTLSDTGSTATADKTFTEVRTALTAGKIIKGKTTIETETILFSLDSYNLDPSAGKFIFVSYQAQSDETYGLITAHIIIVLKADNTADVEYQPEGVGITSIELSEGNIMVTPKYGPEGVLCCAPKNLYLYEYHITGANMEAYISWVDTVEYESSGVTRIHNYLATNHILWNIRGICGATGGEPASCILDISNNPDSETSFIFRRLSPTGAAVDTVVTDASITVAFAHQTTLQKTLPI